PAYLAGFDVAIIPFVVDELTLSVSPIKLFEYLAGGKPVVSTALPECRNVSCVQVAETRDEFVRSLDGALALRDDAAFAERARRVARANTWDMRARAMVDAVEGSSPRP